MLGAWGKRFFDVLVATVLLVAVLPAILLFAVGTAVSLRAWPFFTQRRVGLHGREFRFVKLRTLPTHAPRYASKYEIASLPVPRFSRMLRTLHLDELPQLFLVVTGKMSLVGPRPEMAYLYGEYGPEFTAARTDVRPGCTGLWQISEAHGGMIYEHPEYDQFYVENRSIGLDIWILARTVSVHLPGGSERVITLADVPSATRRRVLEHNGAVMTLEPRVDRQLEPAMQALEA
jgi:lipopolysaccharide/colanic/teichoic acid biosynthesis glycosyltransferase